jgi:hypothetical protein
MGQGSEELETKDSEETSLKWDLHGAAMKSGCWGQHPACTWVTPWNSQLPAEVRNGSILFSFHMEEVQR